MEYLAEEAAICKRFKPLRAHIIGKKSTKRDYCRTTRGSTFEYGSPLSSNKNTNKEKPPFLYPKCNGRNYIKDCTRTAQAEKDELLANLKSKREKKKETKIKKEPKFSFMDDKPKKKVSPFPNLHVPEPSVILANVFGFNFACRIDSGADDNAIPDTIVYFLGGQDVFQPMLRSTKDKTFQAVDDHCIKPSGKVQICMILKTVAGPCRICNIIPEGADCAGEMILGYSLLIHSGLDVKDFISNNLERLLSLDFADTHNEENTTKVGKLGKKLIDYEPVKNFHLRDFSQLLKMVIYRKMTEMILNTRMWTSELKMKLSSRTQLRMLSRDIQSTCPTHSRKTYKIL